MCTCLSITKTSGSKNDKTTSETRWTVGLSIALRQRCLRTFWEFQTEFPGSCLHGAESELAAAAPSKPHSSVNSCPNPIAAKAKAVTDKISSCRGRWYRLVRSHSSWGSGVNEETQEARGGGLQNKQPPRPPSPTSPSGRTSAALGSDREERRWKVSLRGLAPAPQPLFWGRQQNLEVNDRPLNPPAGCGEGFQAGLGIWEKQRCLMSRSAS